MYDLMQDRVISRPLADQDEALFNGGLTLYNGDPTRIISWQCAAEMDYLRSDIMVCVPGRLTYACHILKVDDPNATLAAITIKC